MQTLSVLFCRSNLPGSWLIRAFTWSRWSHVAIIDHDVVIEAVWPRVRVAMLQDVIAAHTAYEIVRLPCLNPDKALKAAYTQVGQPYDVSALFGFIFRNIDWQNKRRWFCSELTAWVFEQGGLPLFRHKALPRIAPQHLWMLNPVQDQQTTA